MAQISSSPKASSSHTSVYDPTEKAIQKAIEGIQWFLNPANMTPEEKEKSVIKISEATEKHFELQIRTLKESPRDPDKLGELLEAKQEAYEKAEDSEVIERLVTEIEILKYVLFLVNRNSSSPPTPN
jgi:hypothetical protein